MQDEPELKESPDPQSVIRSTRMARERLAVEAKRLRRITELQSLKANPVMLSVDTLELLENSRNTQAESSSFATLDEMMVLLRLMSVDSGPDSAGAVSFIAPKTSTVE